MHKTTKTFIATLAAALTTGVIGAGTAYAADASGTAPLATGTGAHAPAAHGAATHKTAVRGSVTHGTGQHGIVAHETVVHEALAHGTGVSHPRGDAVTVPALDINGLTKMLHGPHAQGGQAAQDSTNWAGYVASGATYSSVTSNWVEPSVQCTTDGIVGFWIGLDGYGSNTVEQDGSAVDCSTGTPQHFAWWETYPANSVQEYTDPVSVGDHFTSTVTSLGGGQYSLVLTDSTQGWTESKTVTSAGAANASAEVITEAVSDNGAITPLPDFGSADFSGSTIDGGSLDAAQAQQVDMTDAYGNQIAGTSSADSAGDFTVSYDNQPWNPFSWLSQKTNRSHGALSFALHPVASLTE